MSDHLRSQPCLHWITCTAGRDKAMESDNDRIARHVLKALTLNGTPFELYWLLQRKSNVIGALALRLIEHLANSPDILTQEQRCVCVPVLASVWVLWALLVSIRLARRALVPGYFNGCVTLVFFFLFSIQSALQGTASL